MNDIFLANNFYFARHGETDYNARGVVTGVADIPLNDRGIEQARAAAHMVQSLGVTACFTSPLIRAVHTAELLFEGSNISINSVPMLYERHWGELEGSSKEYLDDYDFVEKKVENWDDFCKRTADALKSIKVTAPVFVVAHSGTYRALCQYLQINVKKEPVRNVWPYRFYKEDNEWKVEVVK
jgi:broad specificity phosphatase PhoE